MKIRKLRLQNFRGFEDKTFEFSDQFNVLVGDNGTGKTSTLDALSNLSKPFIEMFRPVSKGTVKADDARRVQYLEEGGGFIYQEDQYPVVISCKSSLGGQLFEWGIELNHPSEEASHKLLSEKNILEAARAQHDQVMKGKDEVLSLITYYGTGRFWGTSREEAIEWHKPGSRFEGYEGCLDPAPNAMLLLGWLKQQEAIRLQQGGKSGVLNAVKQAIANCMENWGKVKYDFSEDDLVATSVEGFRALPFRMLSDGERNMLAMVADIARRAAILNPHLEERALAETPGIVLIDEIDLHLHPRWQRRVVDNLRETFPNLQFIVTTHSPFIIQALRPGELIDLNEREPAEYENQPIEDITEFVMGVEVPQRSKRYQEMMDVAQAYYRVLQQAKSAPPEEVEQLKKRLDELNAPFSYNVAYHAFLEMEREAAGLGENES